MYHRVANFSMRMGTRNGPLSVWISRPVREASSQIIKGFRTPVDPLSPTRHNHQVWQTVCLPRSHQMKVKAHRHRHHHRQHCQHRRKHRRCQRRVEQNMQPFLFLIHGWSRPLCLTLEVKREEIVTMQSMTGNTCYESRAKGCVCVCMSAAKYTPLYKRCFSKLLK